MSELKEYPPINEALAKQAAREYLDTMDCAAAIAFLREHPDYVSEFCLQIKDAYSKDDTTAVVLEIAAILKELL